jgi:hypothetical protein
MRKTSKAAAIAMIVASCWTIISQGAVFKLPRAINGYSTASASKYPQLRQSPSSPLGWKPTGVTGAPV